VAGQEELLEWLDRARRRDDDGDALNRLLATLRPEILAYLRSRLRSHPSARSVAEEIAQETLLRMAESIDTCRARSEPEFRAWVRTIARRQAIDWYRHREEEFERRVRSFAGDPATQVGMEQVPGRDEGTGIVGLVLWRFLAEAYEGLSPETQEAVWRRLVLGETWAEVGAVIGTTEGGAKRRWQRAVVRMRKEVTRRVRAIESQELRRDLLRRLGDAPT